MQQTVARRMVEGSAAPDFTVEVDVDMTRCVALRAELRKDVDPVPSLNDLVVKAVAVALRDLPARERLLQRARASSSTGA